MVREGAFADIVIFALEEPMDRATYDDPHRLSEGVRCAIVNGVLVIDEGVHLDSFSGRVLRKKLNRVTWARMSCATVATQC